MDFAQNFYFSPDVFLEIWCPIPNLMETFNINVVVESVNGHEFLAYLWSPTGAAGNPFRISLNGYKLLAVSVNSVEGNPYPCNTFLSVRISKGIIPGTLNAITLISGIADFNFALSWPTFNPIPWLEDCKGVIQLAPATGAGVNFAILLSAALIYYPIHFSYKVVAGVGVHNRYPYIYCLENGTNLMLVGANTNAIVGGETAWVMFTPDSQPNMVYKPYYSSNFNRSPVMGGSTINVGLDGIQALDQLSALFARFKVGTI